MIALCPICGGPVGACEGSAPPVRLTPEQLLDIGEISEKEYAAMADQPDHTLPRDEPGGVLPGAEHGYIGVDEDSKFDRPAGGWSNAPADEATSAEEPSKTKAKGKPK